MPETDIETERQIRRLEEQFKRLSITDSEGDLETGFVIRREQIGIGVSVGACCFSDNSCRLLSARDCFNLGGTYKGDQSPCEPNPCIAPTACSLPVEGTCGHAVCFEFKVDVSEKDSDSQPDVFDIIHSGTSSSFAGFWIDWDAHTYSCFAGLAFVGIPIPDITSVPGVWHTVKFTAWKDGVSNDIKARFRIDSLDSGVMTFLTDADHTSCEKFDGIRFGAENFTGLSAHRSIRNIHCLTANTHEESFNFPPDSFDSLVESASIIAGELRIDTDTATDSYGEAKLNLAWNMNCKCLCCERDVEEISTIQITISYTATQNTPATGCPPWTHFGSHTWTFTRIPRATAFTGGADEFKLYTKTGSNPGCCVSVFEINFPGTRTVTGSCFEIDANITDALSFEYDGSCPDAGDVGTLCAGTARVSTFGGFSVDNCDSCASLGTSHAADSGFVIPFTLDDFTALIGTYHDNFTQTFGGGTSATVDVLYTIS